MDVKKIISELRDIYEACFDYQNDKEDIANLIDSLIFDILKDII